MTLSGGEGAEVIYALRNNSKLSDLILDELKSEGQTIRKAYQRRLPSNPSKDYNFMLRNTGITESIIVEYGFLDTPSDATKLKNNYLKYAEAVVRALLQYIGYTETGENAYTVKSGDSLYSIAKKYNVSVEELKAANKLNSNLLKVGQVLQIPTTTEQPMPGEYTVYTVKSGDSLYNIANRYNTTVPTLVDYNNLSSTSLRVGQKILIPTVEPPTQSNYETYIVKSGDSLYRIAQQYNTTIDNLKTINNLTNNALSVGQKLLVPKPTASQPPTSGVTYTVKSGDTIFMGNNE